MAIVPDDKDWTWVVERPCPECGFDGPAVDRSQLGDELRASADAWAGVLRGRSPDDLHRRPEAATWSPLEYACHVRDVYRLYDVRLALMLAEDDPAYPNWDQDVTAVEERYGEQDAERVADELVVAGQRLASAFDGVAGAQWDRTGTCGDGARFTVDAFARYLLHDPVHHLVDVRRPSI